MLIVHASDIHLDSPLVGLERYEGAPVGQLRGAARRALEALVTAAIDERASLLLLAGDLYDGSWRDYATGLFFLAQMRRLRDAEIPVVSIRGNHDAQSVITQHLSLPENLHDLSTSKPETIRFEALGVSVHGQGFATRDVRIDLAKSYPRPDPGVCNIGLLHTALGGREGHETYAPTTLEILRDRGYDYWALGHVHSREVVSRAPHIVYPGNLQGRHVRETGPKGAMFVNVEGTRIASCDFRPFDVVRWSDILVTAGLDDTQEDVLEVIRKAIEGEVNAADDRLAALRVTVRGRTHAHARLTRDPDSLAAEVRLAAADVAGDAVWIGDVRGETGVPLDLDAIAEGDDPLGQLVRSFRTMRADEWAVRELVGSLSELKEKLPPEILDEVRFFDDPSSMLSLLDRVEELLVGRLVDARGVSDEPEPSSRGRSQAS